MKVTIESSPTIARASVAAYLPQLDGVRALAVLAVLFSHFLTPYQFGLPLGRGGVLTFFVLSGFLITGILLRCRDDARHIGASLWTCARQFYIRRFLRIFPLFYAALLIAWLLDIEPIRATLLWHVTYLSNVHVAWGGGFDGAASHLWSLAVEEQFYLLWPWLMLWLPRRVLLPAILFCIGLALAFRGITVFFWFSDIGIRVLTPGCLDALGLGALLAYWHEYRPDTSWLRAVRSPWTAVAAVIGIFVAVKLSTVGIAGWVANLLLYDLAIAVGGLWLVASAVIGFKGVTGRLLCAPPMIYIGRISYGLYVVHLFVPFYLGRFNLGATAETPLLAHVAVAALWTAITFIVAIASWHLMESPINNLKRFFPYIRRREQVESLPTPTETVAFFSESR